MSEELTEDLFEELTERDALSKVKHTTFIVDPRPFTPSLPTLSASNASFVQQQLQRHFYCHIPIRHQILTVFETGVLRADEGEARRVMKRHRVTSHLITNKLGLFTTSVGGAGNVNCGAYCGTDLGCGADFEADCRADCGAEELIEELSEELTEDLSEELTEGLFEELTELLHESKPKLQFHEWGSGSIQIPEVGLRITDGIHTLGLADIAVVRGFPGLLQVSYLIFIPRLRHPFLISHPFFGLAGKTGLSVSYVLRTEFTRWEVADIGVVYWFPGVLQVSYLIFIPTLLHRLSYLIHSSGWPRDALSKVTHPPSLSIQDHAPPPTPFTFSPESFFCSTTTTGTLLRPHTHKAPMGGAGNVNCGANCGTDLGCGADCEADCRADCGAEELTEKHGIPLPSNIHSIISGPASCGKTCVIMPLLEHRNGLKFENRPFCQLIKGMRYFPFKNKDDLVPPNEALPNSVFIFDDVWCKLQGEIQQYFSFGRHSNVDFLNPLQSYARIPKPNWRENENMIIVFKMDNMNMQHIYNDHVLGNMTLTIFKYMCIYCWNKKKHGFLVIIPTLPLYKRRYRSGFDKLNNIISAAKDKYLQAKQARMKWDVLNEGIFKPVRTRLHTFHSVLNKPNGTVLEIKTEE
ncbi:hypothetical protein PR048_019462 [Dryococelus australis]|uniref:Uncharacterized protein n=1 Tax=Dryococelus australis TaxID=614101 RepID=A0ABQ9H3L8_9NEOP|nr:hypothetical protein PR048_019462 [Dryococelus australis]